MSEINAPKFAGRTGWAIIILLSIAWLVTNVHIIVHFRMLDSDSIMYGLPLTVARHPFDLKIPYIGDFETYGRTWGHQWPGAMWIRAGLFSMVPFSRDLDIAFYLVCHWCTALLAGFLVWRTCGSRWLALLVGLFVLSDRLILTGVQLHRFEALAGLPLMLLLVYAWKAGSTIAWPWRLAGYTAAFFAPTLHPYAGPMAFVILGALVLKAFWFKQCPRREAVIACGFFVAGLAAMAAWFFLQPGALEQYLRNVELQKGFSTSYFVVWKGLEHYRFQSGRILWIFGVVASFGVLLGRPRSLLALPGFSLLRFAVPGIVLGLLFLQTVTRCNNQAYMVLGDAGLGLVIAIFAVGLMRTRMKVVGWTLAGVFLFFTLLWATVTPYRVLQYAKAGFPDLKKVPEAMLRAIPAGRKVYIPPPLWDAAARLHLDHEYRLWTFAIASSRERRERYEKWAYADVRPGDVLVIDRLAARNGDVWGILPTESILGPDLQKWRRTAGNKKLFPGGGIDFGYDFEIYEYIGP